MLPTTLVQLRDPDALVAIMKNAGVSIRVLAKRVDLSSARIGQMTSGTGTGMQVGKAVAIAAALDVDVDELFHFPDGEALIRLGLIRDI